MCFESIPIWLTVLSPISFHTTCFMQLDHLYQLIDVNNMTYAIVSCYLLNYWPSDRIKFKPGTVNRTRLILASGTKSVLERLSIGGLDAPAMCTFEFKHFPSLKIKGKCKHAEILLMEAV